MAINPNSVINWNIYKMTSPTNRVYIGLTSNLIKRKSFYKKLLDDSDQPLISKSILKYGFDNHNFQIIDTFQGNLSEAYSKEIFWIRTNMSNKCKYPEINGLNLTNGGKGSSGHKLSKEKRKRLSEARKGRKINRVWTIEQRLACGILNKGRKHTEESKRKISEASKGNTNCKGKKLSPERIEFLRKLSIGNKYNLGRKHSKEEKDKRAASIKLSHTEEWKLNHSKILTKANGRPILQYDINNNLIKEYPSAVLAEKELNLKRHYIKYFLKSGTLSIKTKSYFKYKI